MDFETDGSTYWPRKGFEKTALLVPVSSDGAITVLAASFGEQRMVGPFYIVADGARCYGADRKIFETSHKQLRNGRWIKTGSVVACRAFAPTTIRTIIGHHKESEVVAVTGDWVVKQTDGEVYVLHNDEFERRYTSTQPEQDP